MNIPPGYQLMTDGSYAKASHVGRLVSVKPVDAVDSEAALHAEILEDCRAHGWPVHHARMDRPATCGVGTPDFAIALPNGRTVWIEAKSKTGKLSREQAAWIASLRRHGHTAEVVRSMSEFMLVTNDYNAVARKIAELKNQVAVLAADNDALRGEVSRFMKQQA